MSDDEPRPSLLGRVPPLGYAGVVFLVLALALDDVWAYVAGGTLLVIASLQWARLG